MAKTIATLVGVVFILVGIWVSSPRVFLTPISTLAHNLVHLVSGAVSLYFGTKASLAQARTFCLVFGVVYGLLGIVGMVAGTAGMPSVPHMAEVMHLLKLLPGTLEFWHDGSLHSRVARNVCSWLVDS